MAPVQSSISFISPMKARSFVQNLPDGISTTVNVLADVGDLRHKGRLEEKVVRVTEIVTDLSIITGSGALLLDMAVRSMSTQSRTPSSIFEEAQGDFHSNYERLKVGVRSLQSASDPKSRIQASCGVLFDAYRTVDDAQDSVRDLAAASLKVVTQPMDLMVKAPELSLSSATCRVASPSFFAPWVEVGVS
mmetsp:Transcript_5438/g.8446  ORF Transcript_5438/g.8446 Transcript_5438/m.8446 type:complete len:190 (-) Transcript_5438:718-1287(-)|eukprot:CAMPEP_0184643970 /NCGR_PEP_ID=MMETSP0308-20130426/766_1 /TAXON_ID=38269 /ORGANISM="Gloeochaete witrockiana, Strain SAG 46.84" /LENGTH=189 /DNA_ID=CAMNT_0027072247 /DNA_START=193 /DNA_END=762 /DNA_ORIENTATION=-